jgi:hypothetical protein
MLTLFLTRDVIPELAEHRLVIVGLDHAQDALLDRRRAIATGLPEQQDVLDVVLDDRTRFVGLPEESGVPACLETGVPDLVPDDRRKVVESDVGAVRLDGCMEREHAMSPIITSGSEDIADHDAHPSAGDELIITLLPDLVDLVVERLVLSQVAKLVIAARTVLVVLDVEIRRAGNDQFDAFVLDEPQITGIVLVKLMIGWE